MASFDVAKNTLATIGLNSPIWLVGVEELGMANPEHVRILKQGVEAWNEWREKENEWWVDLSEENLSEMNLSEANLIQASFVKSNLYGVKFQRANLDATNFTDADLSNADLSGSSLRGALFTNAYLSGANLSEADMTGVSLTEVDLSEVDLRHTILTGANLASADLSEADLRGADLRGAFLGDVNLSEADISRADFSGVNLSLAAIDMVTAVGAIFSGANLHRATLNSSNFNEADLTGANLIRTSFVDSYLEGADLSGSYIYGTSVWNVKTDLKTKQENMVVTDLGEPVVTVDNLEVAQFVHLLLHNEKIRDVIDTIGEKGVLILGRFTPERKVILDAIRDKLRKLGFVPMMFDFEKPTQRDFTETIKTLAGMSRFIIADITNPKSAPLELQATVPDYMVPLIPIVEQGEEPFSMFVDLQHKYEWVLDVREYPNAEVLMDKMESAIVKPALEKSGDMLMKRASGIRKKQIEEWQ